MNESNYYRRCLQRIAFVESKPGSDIQLIAKTALEQGPEVTSPMTQSATRHRTDRSVKEKRYRWNLQTQQWYVSD